MRDVYPVVLISLLILWAMPAQARVEFEISAGIGYLTGDTTYDIGDVPAGEDPWGREPYFPVSELKFPLGVGLATLDAKVTIDKLSISGGIRRNITDKAGNMRDYDWGIPFWDEEGVNGPGWYVYVWTDGTHNWYALDIESKSKTEVDVIAWEAKVDYQIFSYHYDYKYRDIFDGSTSHYKGDVRGTFGIGYEKRSFEYDCSLTRQWSPSGIPGYDHIGDGSTTLTYDVDYSIPYAELAVADTMGRLTIGMSFGYSPFVQVKDEDDHLARVPGPIYSKADCTGHALKYGADIGYDITPHWTVKFVFDYLYVRAFGDSDSIIYAGSDGERSWDTMAWTTDERIVSRETYMTLNIAYRFGLP
ncbi:MAG TPA: omptin family outer membrane protease [Deltaproteobacteria bacterium]|jgi:outer membrane protease|nr:omptin family outer membrane protease [Deltaproteobacteria bacterium]HQI00909.1 omptin family outer membrane protease [Deltaproteobacteria bacterium]HQJ09858.1 omptin family outer membrane protease [Deltaproteobacteria bacterium]